MAQERFVYMLPIKGKFHSEAHPHVDLSQTGEERLVVPCFSSGKDELESHLVDQRNCGYADREVFVETNNAICIRPLRNGINWGLSKWLVGRAWKASAGLLRSPAGVLDADTVEAIAKSLLARDTAKKTRELSKKTREMVESLVRTPPASPPSWSVAPPSKT